MRWKEDALTCFGGRRARANVASSELPSTLSGPWRKKVPNERLVYFAKEILNGCRGVTVIDR